jgi:hypothetical protein
LIFKISSAAQKRFLFCVPGILNGRGDEIMQTNLGNLLDKNNRAAEYYHSLHACVREIVDSHAEEIKTQEDLIQIANRGMKDVLKQYGDIYIDSSPYPE